jgi:3-methyladenine DNA glycosylase AlkD
MGLGSAPDASARPFDARRYFRGDHRLRFYNVGTMPMRRLARSIYAANRGAWTVDDAMALADDLIVDPYLETKSVGIELVGRFRRSFSPKLLRRWKRWLAGNHSANWATTDGICGALVGPLLVDHPECAVTMKTWSQSRNLWVRRASIVGLIPLVRTRQGLDLAYETAGVLHRDRADLIQKAVGWTLREAGKVDANRLERYLRAGAATIPRTTVRYAIERFPDTKRRDLLEATRGRS